MEMDPEVLWQGFVTVVKGAVQGTMHLGPYVIMKSSPSVCICFHTCAFIPVLQMQEYICVRLRRLASPLSGAPSPHGTGSQITQSLSCRQPVHMFVVTFTSWLLCWQENWGTFPQLHQLAGPEGCRPGEVLEQILHHESESLVAEYLSSFFHALSSCAG